MPWPGLPLVTRAIAFVATALSAVAVAGHPLPAQEFVRQEVLVAQLRSDTTGGLPAAARDLVELTRDRLGKLLEKSGAHLVEGYKVGNLLSRSNFSRKMVLSDAELRVMATELRADETVFGRLARQDGQYLVQARIGRLRSWGLQQPLPSVRGATLPAVAEQLAQEVLKARAQMTSLRRCENAVLRGDHGTAQREAERAVRAYPQATIARDCQLLALLAEGSAAGGLLAIADTVLAIDSTNTVAAVTRAQALEALQRTASAAAAWGRVYALHPDSLLLATTASEALLRLQEPASALRQVRALQARFGQSAELQRLAFRAHSALAQWPSAVMLGDTLEREDATFRADSNYVSRYIEALRQVGDTLSAIEIGARAVRRHPKDARLYLQYLQLINAEQPAALPRALTRFPSVPEFRLLAANSARKSGDRRAAIANAREAVARDSAVLQPYLALAEDYFQEQQADSAVRVLQRAPRGADSEKLRSYVLARGVAQLRAAGADSLSPGMRAALSLLALADTLRSGDDSRAVLAAGMLQQGRAQLVSAGRSKSCGDLDPMDASLAVAQGAVDRGIGDGASAGEIRSALAAMKSAAEAARKGYCR